jgi:hypothetical protein
VPNSFLEQVLDVLVIERVIDGPSIPPRAHELEIAERTQVMADRGLAHRGELRDVADAELALGQDPDDLDSGIVSERLESLRKQHEEALVLETARELLSESRARSPVSCCCCMHICSYINMFEGGPLSTTEKGGSGKLGGMSGLSVSAVLRCLCPACRQASIRRGLLGLERRCPGCQADLYPENGFFLGAMAVGYLLTAALTIPPMIILKVSGASIATLVAFPLLEFAILGTFILFYSRVLWLHLERRMTGRLDRDRNP